MSRYARERAPDRIAALAGQSHDLATFWNEARDVLSTAVPHYLTPCWYTLDPASLLATSHYDHGLIPQVPAECLAHEYYGDDFLKMENVARAEAGIATLHDATEGDPSRSYAWRQYIQPYGGDQQLLLALRTPAGETWGILSLYREQGQSEFDREELRLLRALSPHLAEGTRRGLLVGEATDPDRPDGPGLVVLDASDWSVESLTPGVERWLADLCDGDWHEGAELPAPVLAVAGRALRTAESDDAPGEVAVARTLTRSGVWIVLHGASLVASGARRVAVIIEPGHPARVASLLMAAYALTEREQEVTRLVLQGDSTNQIANDLFVSPHTVQQHLKNIFEKTGVRSRRDLVGKVFFAHYEPRLRDNEQRALGGQPLRGGPITPASPSERGPAAQQG